MGPRWVAQVNQKVVQVTPKGSQRERRGAQRDPRKVPSGTYFCIFVYVVFWLRLEIDFLMVFGWFGMVFGLFLDVNLDIAEVNAKMARPYDNAVNSNELEGRAAGKTGKIVKTYVENGLQKPVAGRGAF